MEWISARAKGVYIAIVRSYGNHTRSSFIDRRMETIGLLGHCNGFFVDDKGSFIFAEIGFCSVRGDRNVLFSYRIGIDSILLSRRANDYIVEQTNHIHGMLFDHEDGVDSFSTDVSARSDVREWYRNNCPPDRPAVGILDKRPDEQNSLMVMLKAMDIPTVCLSICLGDVIALPPGTTNVMSPNNTLNWCTRQTRGTARLERILRPSGGL